MLLSPQEFKSLLRHHSDGSWKWHSNLSLVVLLGLHLCGKALQGLSSACTTFLQVMVALHLLRSRATGRALRTKKLRHWWWCLVIFGALMLQ